MFLSPLVLALGLSSAGMANERIHDDVRARDIPVRISQPRSAKSCTVRNQCPVAFITPGGGLGPEDYRFIADTFNRLGYLTVGIQSVLPDDPPEGTSGNLIADRSPGWQRGVDDLHAVRRTLSGRYPQYQWEGTLTLVGHSNGGDYAAMALRQQPGFAGTLITLDNRRFPLPSNDAIRVLSIRSSDFPADAGVLPPLMANAQRCIVTIEEARHNDMNDHGPAWLKTRIRQIITSFVSQQRCERAP